MWTQKFHARDAQPLVEKAKEAAKDGAQRVLTQLTERVAANPAAALAIGAGLAWRLFHRPPIATLLVGMGLVGLLRTSPSQHSSQPFMGLHDEDPKPRYRNDAGDGSLATFADVAKEKVQDWSAQASEAVRQTGTQIADKTASVAGRVGWTTVAEVAFLNGLLDSMHGQAKNIATLKQAILSGAQKVELNPQPLPPEPPPRD
jgi:hypothetical protein